MGTCARAVRRTGCAEGHGAAGLELVVKAYEEDCGIVMRRTGCADGHGAAGRQSSRRGLRSCHAQSLVQVSALERGTLCPDRVSHSDSGPSHCTRDENALSASCPSSSQLNSHVADCLEKEQRDIASDLAQLATCSLTLIRSLVDTVNLAEAKVRSGPVVAFRMTCC